MRAVVVILAALIGAPALAQEAPQATSPAGAGVADQIAEFLRTSPAAAIGDEGVPGVTPRDDRRVHGEVAVGIGTGGYRSIYMRSTMPVGETGRVSLAFEDTRFGRGHGPAFSPRFGSSPVFGGAVFGGPIDRQRCDLEALTPPRPLDVRGGPNGRCVGSPGP